MPTHASFRYAEGEGAHARWERKKAGKRRTGDRAREWRAAEEREREARRWARDRDQGEERKVIYQTQERCFSVSRLFLPTVGYSTSCS